MSEQSLRFVTTPLGYQSPTLLVVLIALVLALAFLRRAPTPSLLTLLGAGLLLATAIGIAVGQALLFEAGPFKPPELLMALNIGGALLRALGIGLFVAAIFTGRNPSPADETIYGPPEKLYPPTYPPQPYPPQPYPPQYPAPR